MKATLQILGMDELGHSDRDIIDFDSLQYKFGIIDLQQLFIYMLLFSCESNSTIINVQINNYKILAM